MRRRTAWSSTGSASPASPSTRSSHDRARARLLRARRACCERNAPVAGEMRLLRAKGAGYWRDNQAGALLRARRACCGRNAPVAGATPLMRARRIAGATCAAPATRAHRWSNTFILMNWSKRTYCGCSFGDRAQGRRVGA